MKVIFKSLLSLSFTLCIILIIFSYSTIIVLEQNIAIADSPSFSRQEVEYGQGHAIRVNTIAKSQTVVADQQIDPLDKSSVIQRITYLSDGKNLNATLWLAGNFSKNPSKAEQQSSNYNKDKEPVAVVYGMLIDVDSNPLTGFNGIDYQLEVHWLNSSKMWSMFLGEYRSVDNPNGKNPADYIRMLKTERNYTDLSAEDGKRYVSLSLPLKELAFPNNFKVMYYSTVIHNLSNMVVDLGTWIDIPPLELSLSTFPSPVVITQGEQKNIAVQLKSSHGFITSDLVHFLPLYNYSKIDIRVNNTSTIKDLQDNNGAGHGDGVSNQSGSGIGGPTNFNIKVANDAATGEYTMPILANISTGALFPSGFIWLNGYTFAVPTRGHEVRVANLTMSVTNPMTIEDQVRSFWSAYGGIISLVGAGFGGALASQVLEWIRNRKNQSHQ